MELGNGESFCNGIMYGMILTLAFLIFLFVMSGVIWLYDKCESWIRSWRK